MGNEQEYRGWVRLINDDDYDRPNAWARPLVGWHHARGTRVNHASLVNPMGWASLHVILGKTKDGEEKYLYDQILIVENPGAVVVCLVGQGPNQKVGLVRNFRMTGERISDEVRTYVAGLDEREQWAELLKALGSWEWEVPKGLAPDTCGTNLEEAILRLAKREALEEAGLVLGNIWLAGRANWSLTFCAHAQYVVVGQVTSQTNQMPEDLEILGTMQLFDRKGLRGLVDRGELTDGLGLAALAIAGFHF